MKKSDQEIYITRLRNAMLWHYSNRDLALILEDVHSIFEEGRKCGQTDHEIVEALGTPEDFVHALAQEKNTLPNRGVMLKKVFLILMLLIVVIFLVMTEKNMLNESNVWKNNLVFCTAAVGIPVLIYLFMGGASLYCAGKQESHIKWKYILCLLLSVLLAGYEQFMLTWACRNTQAPIRESYSVIRIAIIVEIVLLLVLVFRLFMGDSWCIGLFSILSGSVGSSVVWCDFVKRFDALPVKPWTFVSIFPCLIGIMLAVLLYILNCKKRKML